jgi:hypothetical protein
MKAFIIYIPNAKSIEYANNCLASFKEFSGWEPELFEGLTTKTLDDYETAVGYFKMKSPSRAEQYCSDNTVKCRIKKCCSLNHYRLFNHCVKLNEPVAVIEHDSHCVGDWGDHEFEDVLVLNTHSAIHQDILRPILSQNMNESGVLRTTNEGIRDINFAGLRYRTLDPELAGQHIMPGTAAYAITPTGARKMVAAYHKYGWEQSDFMINTGYVRIQTVIPELFTFKLPNLSMSHGENIS